MPDRVITSGLWNITHSVLTESHHNASQLAAAITRNASKQTYYTVRYLVDRDRAANAFRAYAYFRWLDDWLDLKTSDRRARLAFVTRQQALVECGYHHEWPGTLTDEEKLLFELIASDDEPDSGLQVYIRHLMAVMAFDAERCGRLISEAELSAYTDHLAVAVTEALHYFIGHDQPAPQCEQRYAAATGAHILHMLRDTFEDADAGYFNVPSEVLEAAGISPCDVDSEPYRAWTKSRVELAKNCLKQGTEYLAQVENRRCRLAGYAYIARFQGVLNTIERDDGVLRMEYREGRHLSGLRICKSALFGLLRGQA